MKTIGDYFEERPSDRLNNFLVLRLVAASLVIYGHAPAISAACSNCKDLVARIGYRYSGDLGLHIFFVISGFLVIASFDRRKNLKDFLAARALRIIPALWVCLILCVALGAIFSTLSTVDFFTSRDTANYLIQNGSLYRAQFTLPGVTFSSSPKYGAVVNGPIWSLFVEVRLYLLVAIAGVAGLIGRRLTANIALILIVALGFIEPARLPFIGEYNENWRLAGFFASGVFAYINRDAIPLSVEVFALILLSAFLSKNSLNYEIAAGAVVAYGVFLIGLSKKIPLPPFIEDFSYGIYLYGWPVSQLVAHYLPNVGPKGLTAIALPVSWLLGAASWHIVEKRALSLKRRPKAMTVVAGTDHDAAASIASPIEIRSR